MPKRTVTAGQKPEPWTGKLVGKMHCEGVTLADLAGVLGHSKGYVCDVLHSRRKPPGAEKQLNAAYEQVIAKRR